MSRYVSLRGITWNHSRGFVPLVATAQRFSELHPHVEIVWHKRSLQEFADYPLQKLVDTYDLLIIDHPFVGYAASHPVLLPLDEHLSADYLADQAENSVGASHLSYVYGGHQWALATDAATPVCSYRPDLLEQHGLSLPGTWEELLELARSGMVILPAIAIDSLMNVYYLCVSQGITIFEGERFIAEEAGASVLEQLRELVRTCPPECLERNPIRTYDALAAGDQYVYCPFAYSYTNYAREGYAQHRLRFGDVVSVGAGPGRTTLGGTGLAVSGHCQHQDVALQYVQYVNSGGVQSTLYVDNGGQPGYRTAWLSERADAVVGNFFSNTLLTHDNAYLRPRYDGYLHFQYHGSLVVHDYLVNGGAVAQTVRKLQQLYEFSLRGTDAIAALG